MSIFEMKSRGEAQLVFNNNYLPACKNSKENWKGGRSFELRLQEEEQRDELTVECNLLRIVLQLLVKPVFLHDVGAMSQVTTA